MSRPRTARPAPLPCLFLAILPTALAGQAIRPLGPPEARSGDGFTSVYDVAELPDGRVLLSDSRERTLAIVDLTDGTVERIGRQGQGPREYTSTFSILPWADGTFRVYDSNQQRFTVVSSSGEILESAPFVRPPLRGFSAPRGPDARGRLYIARRDVGSSGLLRAAVVYRWDPDTGEADSLGVVMQYARGQEGRGIVPMPLGDAWSFLPDGSVARVVGEDYHVEWWHPSGEISSGPPTPYRRIRVGAKERDAWTEEAFRRPAGGASFNGGSGGRSAASTPRTLDPDRFPDHVPPFEVGFTPSSPAGHVWLRLDVESDADRTLYDIIDRAGRLVHRVSIQGNARVVGFGPGSVYLVRVDDLDVEWLERYPYPEG